MAAEPRARAVWRDAPDGAALALALAGFVAARLADALRGGGQASLAVSGGKTPVRFLECLSARDLPWERVHVTLVDERWVDETSDRSNGRMVRNHLLRGAAARAAFHPLYTTAPTPEAAREALDRIVRTLPHPFAAVVLGMGEDGHTASFFPGGDHLASCLDPAGTRRVESLRAPAAGEPRITLTLAAILDAEAIAVHVEGAAKRAVLEQALGDGPTDALPVRGVLRHARTPVSLFWSP